MALRDLVVNIHTGAHYDVYVGRGSRWGNRYTHFPLEGTKAEVQVSTREEAIARYEDDVRSMFERDPAFRAEVLALRGLKLGCHCAPLACHAMVLVLLANPPNG